MMPKGVEHGQALRLRFKRQRGVSLPMMPKGVEHLLKLLSLMDLIKS